MSVTGAWCVSIHTTNLVLRNATGPRTRARKVALVHRLSPVPPPRLQDQPVKFPYRDTDGVFRESRHASANRSRERHRPSYPRRPKPGDQSTLPFAHHHPPTLQSVPAIHDPDTPH